MFLKFLLIENTHQINVILDKFRPILDFFYNWIFTHEKFWCGISILQCGIQIIKDVSTSNTFTEKQIESKCCVLFIFKWNTIIQINAGKKFMKINWFISFHSSFGIEILILDTKTRTTWNNINDKKFSNIKLISYQ